MSYNDGAAFTLLEALWIDTGWLQEMTRVCELGAARGPNPTAEAFQ